MLNYPYDTDIRRSLSRVADAWGDGDPDRYAALFTEDADYTAFDGTHMMGRRAIADGHRALFAGIMRGSRMTMREPGIRFLTPDVAVVCALGGIVMRWQRGRTEPSAKRLSAVTFVLVRQGDDWPVTAFQNTRYRPWSRTVMGRLMARTAREGTR
ncbi:SgcJ/EcaC family oxidoreductase [Streptosporangium amethystogenes]|uniref:SgcJ/EcaC family oxidoreductase n=1 Tax=Streptosporangium amethystogenes TaxID=2002 RepID=UPI0037AFAA29